MMVFQSTAFKRLGSFKTSGVEGHDEVCASPDKEGAPQHSELRINCDLRAPI